MTGRRPLVLPRFGTPRNLDRETRGHEMGEVARRLRRPFMPWQQHAADVVLEVLPDGRNAYDEAVIVTMRQCGRTTWDFVYMVRRVTIVPHRLGRQRVTFTMQKRDNARRKLERDFAPLLRECDGADFFEVRNPKARPGRSTKHWKQSLNNGSEHLLFGQGNYLQIDTPSKQAGHGDTLDGGVIDEARFHVDDRVEQSMRPAQSTRDEAQIVVSSSVGDDESFYLAPKVLAGRKACETGRHGRTAYLEYSLPDDADLDDPEVWWTYHPALGWTIELDFIMAELDRARRNPDEGGEDLFRQEYAGQWVRWPVIGEGPREKVISPGLWAQRVVPEGSLIVGDVAMAVAVAPEGRSAAIAIAGRGTLGRPIVDVLNFDASTFWLEPRIAEQRDAWLPKVIGYPPGPTQALAPEVGRAAGTIPVKPLPPHEYAAACEAFRLGIVEGRLDHLDQAWLNSAVDAAGKKARGDGWLWDQETSLADITPLKAATTALRLLEMVPFDRPVEPLSQIF